MINSQVTKPPMRPYIPCETATFQIVIWANTWAGEQNCGIFLVPIALCFFFQRSIRPWLLGSFLGNDDEITRQNVAVKLAGLRKVRN